MKSVREQEILKLLTEKEYITVAELAKCLFISESSVRRDLTSLENQGLIRRSYGGAELAKSNFEILPFSERTKQNTAAKKVIAKKAAALVSDKSIVFLDQSSSSFFVARELAGRKALTVVTNNPEILVLLLDSEVEVISSGGILSRDNRNCLLGSDAHRIFSEIHADFLFFSAKALTPEGGIYDCTREEVLLRNTMIKNADKKVFLCDSGKFDTYSGFKQCTLGDIDYFISEAEPLFKYKKISDKLIII